MSSCDLRQLGQQTGRGKRRIGYDDVDLTQREHEPLDVLGNREVRCNDLCAQLVCQRLEHIHTPAAQHQRGAA